MGIPKFFRYISERYPLTSQLIQENKIPEFDNLYLDFNGIIHNCSHPNDADAHFRLSEEQIFTAIFAYVDHVFGKIRPKKLFFMAVDGVAPRAKMNQQRSRRFRTAKEGRETAEKALARGEKLPDEKAFDSNCITPGTPFMARLSAQLRYFVNKKISEDANWRNIEVVLSGHEVPGEGEHKIMEYIRLSRAQPDYNPNVRHCLYGLDADLIMLGLLSHDPHFCLLREEVKFGPVRKKGNTSLESINFYLLHLSLMREYLDLEFRSIEDTLPFEYNVERIIDDFVLLAVFVGNDFLPNLPDLHIHQNALERLFDVYKKILPSLEGYINENGSISPARLQKILDEMALWEQEVFEKEYFDASWLKGKQGKHIKALPVDGRGALMMLTTAQKQLYDKVRAFAIGTYSKDDRPQLQFQNTFAARDKKFLTMLCEDLHLPLAWDEFDEDGVNLLVIRLPGKGRDNFMIGALEGGFESSDDDDDDDEESREAIERVLRKYDKLPVVEDTEAAFAARQERSVQEKMDEWKADYYREKLNIKFEKPEEMNPFVFRYVEGLQWVMHYYYSGVASWGWFYDYHYAPRISDLKGVDKMTFIFELGTPFHPYEQLMGVLPAASRENVPPAYHDLMTDPISPIIDFYPVDFEQDLNGKKADWEAIVKIPFIDEKRLLKAMASREHRLTAEERIRNSFGTSTRFTFNHGEPTFYPSSLPGFFPPLYRCQCIEEPFNLPTLDGLHLVQGLCDGVFLGAEALAGFPSLNTLPHVAQVGYHGVNVHGSESRNQSIVVSISNPHEEKTSEEISRESIGKRIFVGWPFLQEGLVVAVSDSHFKYENMSVVPGAPPKVISNQHSLQGLNHWKAKAERIEHTYSKRFGVVTGAVNVLLHVRPLKGLKRLDSGAFTKEYEGLDKEVEHAVQMSLSEVISEDPRYLEREAPKLSEEFPKGSQIFFLGEHAYGVAAQVAATSEASLSVVLAFFAAEKGEHEKLKALVDTRKQEIYYASYRAAEMVGLSGHALSKITSSYMVTSDNQKVNLGLSLKFDAKGLKVVDYSRKSSRHWEFSRKAIDLILEYKMKFPGLFQTLEGRGDAIPRASEILTGPDPDGQVREIKAWLNSKGVRDFEAVGLSVDQLSKETIQEIEKMLDGFCDKSLSCIKKAMVKNIPREAVLRPADAIYRLQNQRFSLGDRVTMVRDFGGIALSAKGVVIGIGMQTIDVIWDTAFMAGTTLSERCSPYRGSTVEFNSCLNLTQRQFLVAVGGSKTPSNTANGHANGAPGAPLPHSRPQAVNPTFRPGQAPVRIMTNNRGRGWHNGAAVRGAPPQQTANTQPSNGVSHGEFVPRPGGVYGPSSRGGLQRGTFPVMRGRVFNPAYRGGRGSRGTARGRGFGPAAPPVES